MKIYNITVPKKYEKHGEEKTMWNNVGKLLVFESEEKGNSYILELSMFPNTKFGVFEQKKREEQQVKYPEENRKVVSEDVSLEESFNPEVDNGEPF